jgi:predicted AlkP superfamily phosphohydrolase/phosphomutase
MPEDVNALKEHVITDEEFMQQSALVHDEGVRMMDYAIARYLAEKDGGFLFFYFSGIDLCGHMMWRHADAEHPAHDVAFAARDSAAWSGRSGSTWRDVIADLYLRMDPVIGDLRSKLPEDTTLVVMSDHGFASYRRKFSLNTWLCDNGYLVLKPGKAKELARDDANHRQVDIASGNVDWSKTVAYGVGFNGLYLNRVGRERDDPHTPEDESGIVKPGSEADALLARIARELEALRDGDRRVVVRCDPAAQIYSGPRVAEAPDLLVGYDVNYGNSDESSLGRIPHAVLEDNLGGTFNGSHLMAPEVVPGLLLSNRAVRDGRHALEDLTVEILQRYGIRPEPGMHGAPVLE